MKMIAKMILFIFSVISIVSTLLTNESSLILSRLIPIDGQGAVQSETLLKMMSSENHYFSQNVETEDTSILSNMLEIATNINIKDVRSLIFDEVPGLFAMTSDIIVAGEGTDFTNLPIESSPPLEELLKDREVVEGSLDNLDDGDKEEQPPSIEKPKKNTVFIYHSHSRESFIPHIKDTSGASTAQHKDINITLVGKRLGEKLMEKGIGTVVDTTDIPTVLSEHGWEYWQSYDASREVVQEALAQNDDFVYLFDIHRDSAQWKTTTTTMNGKNYAKLYFVLGESNPNYKKNEEFAKELNAMIKEKYPKLTRGIFRKDNSGGNNGVYNQDLSPDSILIEIGGPENTLEEMYNTVDLLADIIAEHYWEDDVIEVNG
ncbi:stage II sporulation protein P [Caldibacillus lycopersici]|uniref:Stage II sporulation protein P n=1 Tax=Perspicuibacillus lycopersici TaxID=1325689 RepID=A0AAE3LP71_9BACI|nr:stage II sporulation protein P [Perspicuibacillus lycopersici]MCU9614696.1 stage II sporulation protein P [Perspicuibacillus lycopersici]